MYIQQQRRAGPVANMRLPRREESFASRVVHRASPENNISMIIGFAVVAMIIFSVSFFCYMRNRRIKKRDKQKYQQAPLSDPSDVQRPAVSSIPSNNSSATTRPPAATVDRTTSIRSIMTLPAYRPKASNEERVLGREGERDGVDVVLELPSEQDIEDLRENEMESLYQIRVARRLEMQEREERRRLRREARQNHDAVALRQLREQRQAASERNLVTALREEHDRIKNQRHRAVPSVAYADVGIARHDGTRIRGTSMESERVGLLSDAASISASMQSPRHTRDRSGSVLSVDSDVVPPPITAATTRTRSDSQVSQLPSPGFPAGNSISTARNSTSTTRPTREALSGGPSAPPEYEDIPLTTTSTRHSTLTTRSVVPTEPPPTYEGAESPMSGNQSQAVFTTQSSSHDIASTSSESPVHTPTVSWSEEASAGHHSHTQSPSTSAAPQEHGGPLRLPSLRLGDLPQIVVQPSPTDLQRSLVPEETGEDDQRRTSHS